MEFTELLPILLTGLTVSVVGLVVFVFQRSMSDSNDIKKAVAETNKGVAETNKSVTEARFELADVRLDITKLMVQHDATDERSRSNLKDVEALKLDVHSLKGGQRQVAEWLKEILEKDK